MILETTTHHFQAETVRLLELVVHSLYTEKGIFLQELVSNASDALDRLRFETLLDPAVVDGGHRFEIHLEIGQSPRTLTVSDSGIGMSRDEVINNLGVIARSGTREMRERAAGPKTRVMSRISSASLASDSIPPSWLPNGSW